MIVNKIRNKLKAQGQGVNMISKKMNLIYLMIYPVLNITLIFRILNYRDLRFPNRSNGVKMSQSNITNRKNLIILCMDNKNRQ